MKIIITGLICISSYMLIVQSLINNAMYSLYGAINKEVWYPLIKSIENLDANAFIVVD
ncbi:MAG: hypothetical protein IPO92_07925 [Saprospiraceae bacterium]|nr:hypothetical protein [Saprospiraceae bacterium]